MATDKQAKLNELIEDLELRQFILDDLKASQPNDSASIAEAQAEVDAYQAKIANLLGEDTPAAPQPAAPASASRPDPLAVSRQPDTTSPHSAAPSSSQIVESVPPASVRPEMPSLNPPNHTVAPVVRQDPRADPASTPYWPSSAPSPFAASSSQQPRYPPPIPPEGSRKRQRQDSGGALAQPQSSKRTIVKNSESRMKNIDAMLERELAETRKMYEELRQPDNLRCAAITQGISEDRLRHNLEEEEAEMEREIRKEFRVKQDAELARMLQAVDEPSEDEHDLDVLPSLFNPPPPAYNIPPVARPISTPGSNPQLLSTFNRPPPVDSRSPISLPDRTHYQIPPPGRLPYMSGNPLQQSSSPFVDPYGRVKREDEIRRQPLSVLPSFPNLTNGDDDLQEISPAYFNSRFGGPPRFGPPPMPSRPLPWMHDPWAGDTDAVAKAMELVREQVEQDMDDDDLVRYEEADFPQDIRNLLTGIKDIREATKADQDETPSALKVTLMKHQAIGLAWMKAKEESSHKGGILADDMGLGKTIQAIALMTARPPTDPERHPCLIVCPKALMDQWRLEIQRHVHPGRHQLSVFIFHDKQRNIPWRELKRYDVVITTFGTLTANHKLLLQAEKLEKEGKDASIVRKLREQAHLFLPASKWHRVIVDEAQNIKNPLAKSTKACCALNAAHRWCLTGTPMMNRLEDFQSLLGFLRIRPYNNKEKFKATFIRPIKSGTYGEQAMQQLRVLVKAVCLRRTKESKIDGQPILQLPPKVIEKVHTVFSEKENEMYAALNTRTQSQVTRLLDAGQLGRNYSHVLVLLLRLRQACCHPLLMHEFSTELPTSVQGVDLIANAKLLSVTVVDRLKNNEDEDDGTCPICMDSVENAVIYIPCGHSVCSECFARISDPTVLARDDTSGMIKCQNCRGPVDPLKITDANSFKKAHDPNSATESAAAAEDTEPSSESETEEYDSDTETDGAARKPKKKSLAELRQAAQKNKREKKRYLRRLEKTWIPSAKTEKAMEILQSIQSNQLNEKTIIFSQFTSLLDLLEVPINRRGWKYVRFDGTMNISDRNAAIAAFTDDPDVKIMLVSLKAGNAGLNLVAASHVILFDPFWNPYVEDQAIDRAHRIGQARDVFVHRLLIEGTVEDRIVELQEKKRELIGGALDERGVMNVSRLDVRELAYLFGVRQ